MEAIGDRNSSILPSEPSHTYRQSNQDERACTQKIKDKKWIIIGSVAVILILALILGLTLGHKNPGPSPGPSPPNVYNPYVVDEASVQWNNSVVTGRAEIKQSTLDALNSLPKTFYSDGLVIKADPSQVPTGINNEVIRSVFFEVGQINYKAVKVTLTDSFQQRFSPPTDFVRKPEHSKLKRIDMCGLEIFNEPFGFAFKDDRTAIDIVSTKESALILMDKYIQMDIQLPSRRIYGLGERVTNFSLGEGTWTMWANGARNGVDDGKGGKQGSSVHPFILVQSATKGEFLGIYFRNSNAMSPVIKYTDDGKSTFSFITVGGQIEMYIMMKGSAKEIIKQYHLIIGTPFLASLWSLGWNIEGHYSTSSEWIKVFNQFNNTDFPIESIWINQEYLITDDFQINTTNFPNFNSQFGPYIHYAKKKIGVKVTPYLYNDVKNPVYTTAQQNNLLIQSTINNQILEGELTQKTPQGREAVYLDMFNPMSVDFWKNITQRVFGQTQFDGMMINDNQPIGMCNGECPVQEEKRRLSEDEKNNTWWSSYNSQSELSTYKLPFIPGGNWNLDNMTISLNATHPSNNLTQFNTHSLYGHTFATNSLIAYKQYFINDRLFLQSRSTFPGSGSSVSQTLGPSQRTWEAMRYQIASIMNSNLFGIPMAGPDTCGTLGNYDEELCARWIQLASFFPYARLNDIQPFKMSEPYQSWARNAFYNRLGYVRQMYQCWFTVSKEGGTCFDPLFLHYPNVEQAYDNIEHTFIFANVLKITPILEPKVNLIKSFFPNGSWVNMNNLSDIIQVNNIFGGMYVNLTVSRSEYDLPITHLMPGKILHFMNNTNNYWKTADEMCWKYFGNSIIINPDSNGYAEGRLFFDTGITISANRDKLYEYYSLRLKNKTITNSFPDEDLLGNHLNYAFDIDFFLITNAEHLSTTNFACWRDLHGYLHDISFAYDKVLKTLNLTFADKMNKFQDLYFGDTNRDINLCHPETHFYRIKEGQSLNLSANSTSIQLESMTPNIFEDLILNMSIIDYALNFHWTYADPEKSQRLYQVPQEIVNVNRSNLIDQGLSRFLTIRQDEGKPMEIDVRDWIIGGPIYTLRGMLLADNFNYQFGTAHTNTQDGTNFTGVMGLVSEQSGTDMWLKDGVYSLWNRNAPVNQFQNGTAGFNSRSFHPQVIGRSDQYTWFGLFNNNPSAQDWYIRNNGSSGDVNITTIASGGIGDFFINIGGSPNYINLFYQKTIVGFPVSTPLWALGWGISNYGHYESDKLKEIVMNYTTFGLPLESMYSDFNLTDNFRDFTASLGLREFVDYLHDHNLKFVPQVDSAVAYRKDYQGFTDGQQRGVFLKTDSGDTYIGQSFAGDVAFPDFANDQTLDYWKGQFDNMFNNVPFDGIIHTYHNFCNETCYQNQVSAKSISKSLIYTPTWRELNLGSISIDTVHANGRKDIEMHSLYGTMQARASQIWFQSKAKRPLILSQFTFPGFGKFGSTFIADNASSKQAMSSGVVSTMGANTAGILLAGADACGSGQPNPELCARWYMVSAFQPLSRATNPLAAPWLFATARYETTVSYLDIIRHAMYLKLHLVRYFYTQMQSASQRAGAVYRPIYYDYSNSKQALNAPLALNILLGDSLKLSIQSQELNKNTTQYFFPQGVWCDIFNRNGTNGCMNIKNDNSSITFPSKAYNFQLHIKQCTVVPLHDATILSRQFNVTTTKDLQKIPIDFHLVPEYYPMSSYYLFTATGSYLNDDGESTTLDGNQNQWYIEFMQDPDYHPENLTLKFNQEKWAYNYPGNRVNDNDAFKNIYIYNAMYRGYNTTYSTEALMTDYSRQVLEDAIYDQITDRLVYTSKDQIWMMDVRQLTFTKK